MAARPATQAAVGGAKGHPLVIKVVDFGDLSRGLQNWSADVRQDPGRGTNYTEPQPSNPDSFAAKFQQMRQRQVPSDEIERDIDARFRQSISRELPYRKA